MADRKEATVTWSGEGLSFAATLGSGHEFEMGSPAGEAIGSPMEFLLAGVAGCTAVDVVSILRKMRQPIDGLTVEINGIRADDHPKVYQTAELVYVVQGQGVDAEAVERAIRLSKDKYCSASIMFQRAGVSFQTSYRIEEKSTERPSITPA